VTRAILLLVMLSFPYGVAIAMETPWSVSESDPAISDNIKKFSPVKKEEHFKPPNTNPLIWLVRGFQIYVSPVDGDRCISYPTCSSYGIQALRKHGPVKGFVLTADRVLHEGDEHYLAPKLLRGGRLWIYDPVERNDSWWHE